MTLKVPNETSNETNPVTDRGLSEHENPTPITKPRPMRRIGLAIGALLLLGAIGGFVVTRSPAAKPDKAGKGGKDQVTPVLVATVTQKTVPVQISAIGHVQADSTVSVTPQAGGRITSVLFKKGEEVHKGQLLFTLDDRSQSASMQQVRGGVAKDQAQVQQARAVMEKDLGLVKQARSVVDKDLGLIGQAQATLARDQGLVRQAEATLAKDEAQGQFAQAQSDRYNNLYKQGAISQDQAQQYNANSKVSAATLQADREAITNAGAVVRSDEIAIENAKAVMAGDQVAIENAEAVVKGDKAAIENAEAVLSGDGGALNNAEVQSSYTKIYAPIDGRAGNILVTEGNVVQANSNNPLVVIQKIRPIQVAFAVPESNLPEIQKRMDNGNLPVDVTFTGSDHPIAGRLSFLNNTVDNATGSIQLIGDFDNAEGNLFPGQFVNTTLTLKQQQNATVVPAQAVQNGPNGQFVFVVKPDDTVENVPVVASPSVDGLDVIQKGVQPGDQVVVDGQANLVTGSKIRVKDPNSDAKGSDNSDSKNPANPQKSGSWKSKSKDTGNAAPDAAGNNSANSTASPTANPTASPAASNGDAAPPQGKKHHRKKPDTAPTPGGNP
jgi:membrane fusion protein, multidrug efflux system